VKQAVNALKKEIKILKSLKHKNIVRYIDSHIIEGSGNKNYNKLIFIIGVDIVMELVSG